MKLFRLDSAEAQDNRGHLPNRDSGHILSEIEKPWYVLCPCPATPGNRGLKICRMRGLSLSDICPVNYQNLTGKRMHECLAWASTGDGKQGIALDRQIEQLEGTKAEHKEAGGVARCLRTEENHSQPAGLVMHWPGSGALLGWTSRDRKRRGS